VVAVSRLRRPFDAITMADLSAIVAGCVARPIRSRASMHAILEGLWSLLRQRLWGSGIGTWHRRTNLSETLFERLFKRGPMHKHVMEFLTQ
jgi:hypothetical protein